MIDWGLFSVVILLLLLVVGAGAGVLRVHVLAGELARQMIEVRTIGQDATAAKAGHRDILRRLDALESMRESVDERIRGVNARVSTVSRELRRALDEGSASEDDQVEAPEPSPAPFFPPPAATAPPVPGVNPAVNSGFGRKAGEYGTR